MDTRVRKTVIICDNDADHSFTMEGELRNRDYEVIIITDPTELIRSVKSLKPVALVVNPDMKGFNETEVCRVVKTEMNIPVILILERNSAHTATIGDCRADDVMGKPAEVDILANLIAKQMAWHKSQP